MERPPGIDGVSRFMGLRWDDSHTTRMEIRPELMNAAGFLAGVSTYAMIDYTMGSALWRETGDEEGIATLNIAINYVQTALEGELSAPPRSTAATAAARSCAARSATPTGG